MRITSATHQGSRNHQEDRFVVQEDSAGGGFFAVMDGHSGDFVSGFIARNILEIFSKEMTQLKNPEQAILATFAELNSRTRNVGAGSTLSLVLIPPEEDRVYIGILGDSPVILRHGGKTWVSPEHNARNNESERKAAEARGAVYSNGYLYDGSGECGLQLSRAFGDAALGNILNREPEIFEMALAEGDVIVLATDGVVDPAHQDSSAMAKHVLALAEKHGDAEYLVHDALDRQTRDNVTAIVCRI